MWQLVTNQASKPAFSFLQMRLMIYEGPTALQTVHTSSTQDAHATQTELLSYRLAN